MEIYFFCAPLRWFEEDYTRRVSFVVVRPMMLVSTVGITHGRALVDLAMACARLVLLVTWLTAVCFPWLSALLVDDNCGRCTAGVAGPCSMFFSTAPCIWQPLVRCLAGVHVCGFFWGVTSRNVSVFSIIWLDSGYRFMSVYGVVAGFGLCFATDRYAQCKLRNFLLGQGC